MLARKFFPTSTRELPSLHLQIFTLEFISNSFSFDHTQVFQHKSPHQVIMKFLSPLLLLACSLVAATPVSSESHPQLAKRELSYRQKIAENYFESQNEDVATLSGFLGLLQLNEPTRQSISVYTEVYKSVLLDILGELDMTIPAVT